MTTNINSETSKTIKEYSLFMSALITFLVLNICKGYSENGVLNIALYAVVMVAFIFAFMVFQGVFLLVYHVTKDKITLSRMAPVFTIIVLVAAVIWFCNAYVAETFDVKQMQLEYFRHKMPTIVYMIVLVSCVFIAFVEAVKQPQIQRKTRWLLIFLVAILQAVLLYMPNFEEDGYGTIYHADAYANSIYNVLMGAPYSEEMLGIYGHYGLLFVIPVRVIMLFGANMWIAITLTIATFGFIAFSLQGILLDKVIKNDVIFILAVFATAVPSFQIYYGTYYQALPHRVLFPALVLLGCYYCINNSDKKKLLVFQWIIVSVSWLWNIETGAVCLIVWALAYLYIKTANNQKYSIAIIGKTIVMSIMSFVAAYVVFNGINIVLGGKWQTIKLFLFPIGSQNSKIQDLQMPLQSGFAGHCFAIVLFMSVVCFWLIDIFRLRVNKNNLFLVLSSIMGLGLFTYYINRVITSNASIIAIEIVIVMAIIIDKVLGNVSQDFNGISPQKILKSINSEVVACIALLTVLVSMFLAAVSTVGSNMAVVSQAGLNKANIEQMTTTIDAIVPEDTAAYGFGVAPLYAYLNRDTKIYMEDWEDLNFFSSEESYQYLVSELEAKQYDYLLTGNWDEIYVPAGYAKIYSYNPDSGVYYCLYTNKQLPREYYFILSMYCAMEEAHDADEMVSLAQGVHDGNKAAEDELWNQLNDSDKIYEGMDDDAYICFLYEQILGRRVTESEYSYAVNKIQEASKEELLFDMMRNADYQQEAGVVRGVLQ